MFSQQRSSRQQVQTDRLVIFKTRTKADFGVSNPFLYGNTENFIKKRGNFIRYFLNDGNIKA